jgi:hypothetical protein
MFESRYAKRAATAGFIQSIDSWLKPRNPRWAHTLLRRGLGMLTTVFTPVAVGSFITAPSYTPFIGDRWKKFLSHVSLEGTLSGFDLTRAPTSIARK